MNFAGRHIIIDIQAKLLKHCCRYYHIVFAKWLASNEKT